MPHCATLQQLHSDDPPDHESDPPASIQEAVHDARVHRLVMRDRFPLDLLQHTAPSRRVRSGEEAVDGGEEGQTQRARSGGEAPEQEDGEGGPDCGEEGDCERGRAGAAEEGEAVAEDAEGDAGDDAGQVEEGEHEGAFGGREVQDLPRVAGEVRLGETVAAAEDDVGEVEDVECGVG